MIPYLDRVAGNAINPVKRVRGPGSAKLIPRKLFSREDKAEFVVLLIKVVDR